MLVVTPPSLLSLGKRDKIYTLNMVALQAEEFFQWAHHEFGEVPGLDEASMRDKIRICIYKIILTHAFFEHIKKPFEHFPTTLLYSKTWR